MAVRIRLKRVGAKMHPVYRVVVANSTAARNGKFIDTIGTYDPHHEPAKIEIDEEKAFKWLGHGATPSETAGDLLKQKGILARFEAAKQKAREAAGSGS